MRLFFISAGVWLLIITTKFIPRLLISQLESKYPPMIKVDDYRDKKSVNIMILGGGYSDDPSLPPNDQLNTTTLGRLTEGLRLYRLIPGSRLVTGDYNGTLIFSQSVSIEKTAVALGAKESDIIAFKLTRNNTKGESEAYYSQFGSSNPLIVVTDAIHMPRAIKLFRMAGLNPIPAPTNHILKHGSKKNPFSWLPSISNVGRMEAAMHEYVGMIWTRLGGE
jgi:uncharacterized SAM-binding protein YcdF (DUF218 family)